MTEQKRQAYIEAIQDCIEVNSDDFNDWESGFLENIQDQLLQGGNLFGNQKPKLLEVLDSYDIKVNL